jgi:hypothetical protein
MYLDFRGLMIEINFYIQMMDIKLTLNFKIIVLYFHYLTIIIFPHSTASITGYPSPKKK